MLSGNNSNQSPSLLEFKEGDTIIGQGIVLEKLLLLKQGKVDFILQHGDPQRQYHLFSFQGPCFLAIPALLLEIGQPYHLIAHTACQIMSYPKEHSTIIHSIATQENIGTTMIRSLIKEIIELHNKMMLLTTLDVNLEKYLSSLSLAYLTMDESLLNLMQQVEVDSKIYTDTLLHKLYIIYQQNLTEGITFPIQITDEFLHEDHIHAESLIQSLIILDKEELNYFRHFSLLPPAILNAISTTDPEFIFSTIKRLSKIYLNLVTSFDHLVDSLEQNLSYILFVPNNYLERSIEQLIKFQNGLSKSNLNSLLLYLKFLWKILQYLDKQYKILFSYSLSENINLSLIEKIKSFIINPSTINSQPKDSVIKESVANSTNDTEILNQFNNTSNQIMNYAEISLEVQKTYQETIKVFKSFDNLLNTEGDIRKIRKQVNIFFWSFYESVIIKHLKVKDTLSPVLLLFINYGVLEEDLLEPSQLLYLAQVKESVDTIKYPFYTPLEWFKEIYAGKKPTSVNELGLSFFDILKQENPEAGWKRESDVPTTVLNPESKVTYEIRNIFPIASRLTSGSVTNNIAMLTKYQITQSIERSLVTKAFLAQQFDFLLARDYTCFHREVLFENPDAGISHEFVQVQVLPVIILIPMAGGNFQFWQEKDSKDKYSPGRLLCPMVSTADLCRMVLSVSACYRWELTKFLLGPDWNNISQSSITADYTDYVQFFKKNKELSIEIKERLAQDFKRFRDDRSRFVHDYIIWVLHESEGVQRLNRIARKIFAKHIPFPKAIREKLLKLPSYTDLINKSVNVKHRKAVELEPRLKKYRQSMGGVAPEVIEKTYKFYLMEE